MIVTVAMKPLDGMFAGNAVRYGVAGLHIDESRIETSKAERDQMREMSKGFVGRKMGDVGQWNYGYEDSMMIKTLSEPHPNGRWPANVIFDGNAEVSDEIPEAARRFFKQVKG